MLGGTVIKLLFHYIINVNVKTKLYKVHDCSNITVTILQLLKNISQ
jgi:hypothetical protein